VSAVRYCYYPAFAPLVRQWAVPVGGVLARMPQVSGHSLTVRQVEDDSFLAAPLLSPTPLTSNGPAQSPAGNTLNDFQLALLADPRLIPGSSGPPVYTDLTWHSGSTLGVSQFALALTTAQWATGLPTTGRYVTYGSAAVGGGTQLVTCVPLDQAREAIALWLAGGATPAARAVFDALTAGGATQVGRKWVAAYTVPGSGPLVGLTVTDQGVALAKEMLRQPGSRVEAVLGARWRHWLEPQATDASLASAVGVPLPPEPAAKPQPDGESQASGQAPVYSNGPPSPVCR
jgi:hypothetical protein